MSLEQRIENLRLQSIGQEVRLAVKPQTFVRGVIASCVFVGWRVHGKTRNAQFEVTLECGPKKVRHVHLVENLPNGRSEKVPEIRIADWNEKASANPW